MAKKLRFETTIQGEEVGVGAAITLPFDVPEVFGTRARVPVSGTINGFPFRSSLMPMRGCYMMPVNQSLREGAGVKPGDMVDVVMERDEAMRTVEPPEPLKKISPGTRLRRQIGKSCRLPIRKKSPDGSKKLRRKRRGVGDWRRPYKFWNQARNGQGRLIRQRLVPRTVRTTSAMSFS